MFSCTNNLTLSVPNRWSDKNGIIKKRKERRESWFELQTKFICKVHNPDIEWTNLLPSSFGCQLFYQNKYYVLIKKYIPWGTVWEFCVLPSHTLPDIFLLWKKKNNCLNKKAGMMWKYPSSLSPVKHSWCSVTSAGKVVPTEMPQQYCTEHGLGHGP